MRIVLALAAAVLLLGGCAEDTATRSSSTGDRFEDSFKGAFKNVEAYPVFISSEIVVGRNRFLLGVLDDNDAPIGHPDINVRVAFYDLESDARTPVSERPMDFVWSVEGERGVYVTGARFDHPGKWGAEVSINGRGIDETVRGSFKVAPEPSTPGLGDAAPPVDNVTSSDTNDLSEITTDQNPDPSFYRLSVADALRIGRPFVITFATPKFCTSAVCGPTLDIVKEVSHDFPKVKFIHIEVYENLDDPDNLKVVPAVEEWSLPTEPWVFVVDGKGDIYAKYEGIVGENELRSALNSL